MGFHLKLLLIGAQIVVSVKSQKEGTSEGLEEPSGPLPQQLGQSYGIYWRGRVADSYLSSKRRCNVLGPVLCIFTFVHQILTMTVDSR